MVARHFGMDPIVQYKAAEVNEVRQKAIDTVAHTFVEHSRQRRTLLIERLEILRLLDVVLSKAR